MPGGREADASRIRCPDELGSAENAARTGERAPPVEVVVVVVLVVGVVVVPGGATVALPEAVVPAPPASLMTRLSAYEPARPYVWLPLTSNPAPDCWMLPGELEPSPQPIVAV
jgi:hypothetical protein